MRAKRLHLRYPATWAECGSALPGGEKSSREEETPVTKYPDCEAAPVGSAKYRGYDVFECLFGALLGPRSKNPVGLRTKHTFRSNSEGISDRSPWQNISAYEATLTELVGR
jgi:hypothetical protein